MLYISFDRWMCDFVVLGLVFRYQAKLGERLWNDLFCMAWDVELQLNQFDECRLSAGWPPTLRPSQPTSAVSPPINGCYRPHPPLPFVIITQPESWSLFYHPSEGGRLSRPRHYRKGTQPLTKAVHRSGCHDKHNWPRPLAPQSFMPSLDHCDLQRHVGVNNLPKVVSPQRCNHRVARPMP